MRRDRVSERIRQLSPAKRLLLGRLLEERSYDPSFLDSPAVPPQSPLQTLLAEVWQEVLGLDSVGVEDNFFDLGGDSILSIRIVAKAQRKSIPLTSRQLFENPTIALLSRQLEAAWQGRSAARTGIVADHRRTKGPGLEAGPLRRRGPELSPEDFPEAELSSEDLATILSRVAARADLEVVEDSQPALQRAAAGL